MKTDEIIFAPPDDNHFQLLMERAVKGKVPVYGIVVEAAKVRLRRSYPAHRPELTKVGAEIVAAMAAGWQQGKTIQPWLYTKDNQYIVADDYFWLALIEKYGVDTFAAQVLGKPLQEGLVQKVGPLERSQILRMLGLDPKL